MLWSPFVSFDQVAALASSRDFPLTLGVPAHLQHGRQPGAALPPDEAHHLLNQSFAQFQADRSVVRMETRRASRRAALEAGRGGRRLRAGRRARSTGSCCRRRAIARPADRLADDDVEDALSRLRPGDVIRAGGDRAAVLSVALPQRGDVRVCGR